MIASMIRIEPCLFFWLNADKSRLLRSLCHEWIRLRAFMARVKYRHKNFYTIFFK